MCWSMTIDRMPRLRLPSRSTSNPAPVTRDRRLALIRGLLTDQRAPMRERVAGLLLLLYAQPVSRIVRLTIDDVRRVDDQVLLRLGDPPVPVPAPFADLLLALAGNRTNMATATNQDARWLFPGAPTWAADTTEQSRTGSPSAWYPGPERSHCRHPSARSPSPSGGGRGNARLPRQDHCSTRDGGRRHLESLRPRRPWSATVNSTTPFPAPPTRTCPGCQGPAPLEVAASAGTFYPGWICLRCLVEDADDLLLDVIDLYRTREEAEWDLLSEHASLESLDPDFDAVPSGA
jgi:hypothetical protein